jgi:hypothetical protein
VLADVFCAKREDSAETLLSSVAALIQTSATQAMSHQDSSAPVWIPRNGKDWNGIHYIVITCTECLRSFPLNVTTKENPEVLKTQCRFVRTWSNTLLIFLFQCSLQQRCRPRPSFGETRLVGARDGRVRIAATLFFSPGLAHFWRFRFSAELLKCTRSKQSGRDASPSPNANGVPALRYFKEAG